MRSDAGARWVVLCAYLGALVLTQIYWYNFAPLISLLIGKYHVSELAAGWTVLVFPLASMIFSGHAGALIDRRGYRFSIQAGLALMAISSAFRIFDQSFWMLLIGQAGAAVSVPYVVTGISKLVTDWFDPGREALITGFCTIGIFIGMSLSLAASPVLVERLGFRGAMFAFAAVTTVWSLVFKLTVRENHPRAQAAAAAEAANWRTLFRNRNLLILFASAFIGQGCFNALTTWMEVIWHERGFASDAAGLAGGLVIAGGILGSLIIPPLQDRLHNARLLLWACLVPGTFLVQPFLWAASPQRGYVWGSALGFLWLPSLAISLTVLEQSTHKEHSGAAAGLFWTIGNAGVLGLTVLFELLKQATNWRVPVYGVMVLMLLMNASIGLLKEPGRGRVETATGVETS